MRKVLIGCRKYVVCSRSVCLERGLIDSSWSRPTAEGKTQADYGWGQDGKGAGTDGPLMSHCTRQLSHLDTVLAHTQVRDELVGFYA